ncbi:hypothetical protein EDB92DRAFT_171599 [Lactarius akahatsu]|uniref:Uncharacterized protein n=1 Tax=Lactarius akahatsu TaxID=416441 RepID=A0AAD4L606_9AGAM|nr:hypothetical protein EDB92DRAFT_171599 [Lactarius akahatsu]
MQMQMVKMRARVHLMRFPRVMRALNMGTEHSEGRLAAVERSMFVPHRVVWLAREWWGGWAPQAVALAHWAVAYSWGDKNRRERNQIMVALSRPIKGRATDAGQIDSCHSTRKRPRTWPMDTLFAIQTADGIESGWRHACARIVLPFVGALSMCSFAILASAGLHRVKRIAISDWRFAQGAFYQWRKCNRSREQRHCRPGDTGHLASNGAEDRHAGGIGHELGYTGGTMAMASCTKRQRVGSVDALTRRSPTQFGPLLPSLSGSRTRVSNEVIQTCRSDTIQ